MMLGIVEQQRPIPILRRHWHACMHSTQHLGLQRIVEAVGKTLEALKESAVRPPLRLPSCAELFEKATPISSIPTESTSQASAASLVDVMRPSGRLDGSRGRGGHR